MRSGTTELPTDHIENMIMILVYKAIEPNSHQYPEYLIVKI